MKKIWIAKRIALTGWALALVGCVSTPPAPSPDPSASSDSESTSRVSVMTYNVENLFDTVDNPEKNDESFLPRDLKSSDYYRNKCRAQNLRYKNMRDDEPVGNADDRGITTYRLDECLNKDWSKRAMERKLSRLTDVLKQVNKGRGPDILFLQEIENIDVLRYWRDKYLAPMNYNTLVLMEGPDDRGIDTAIISRFEQVGEPQLHTIDFSTEPDIPADQRRPTRGILEARLKLPNGETVAAFSLHWPSQGAPSSHRRAGAKALLTAVQKVPVGMKILAGGDTNITSMEEWKTKYFRDLLGRELLVSHLEGCKGCLGTTYYSEDSTWSFFDVLFFDKEMKNEAASVRLDPASIHIVNTSIYQKDSRGKPAKFGAGHRSIGVSDHWPVYAELILNQPPRVGVNP